MYIKLARAFTNYEEGLYKIISLYFMSDHGYEQAYEFFLKEILNRDRLNEFSKRDCKYDIYSAHKYGDFRCINLAFKYDDDRKYFWNNYIVVFGDQDDSNKRIYLDIPAYECDIRGAKMPFGEYRFEKYDRVLNAKAIFIDDEEYKRRRKMYLEIIDGRRNGKATVKDLLNLIYGTSQLTNDLIPAMIRSVQINERKGVTTIVWKNGCVTMAKCGPNETFDPEKGIAICIMKRFFSSTTKMNKWLKEQTAEYYERLDTEEDRHSLKDLVESFIKNA